MKRRIFSLLLAISLLAALAAPASALGYSDLEGHWAKTYMEDLAERGYLTGYEDGTMRPNANITVCEALVFLSRFYSLDEEAIKRIESDYGSTASAIAGTGLAWASDELSICLAAGILTEAELRAVDLRAAIQKELLTVFLVRAMGQQSAADALSDASLSFADAGDITAAYRGHAAYLVSIGIVEGDTDNKFSPKLSVTRAVVSTMVSRALDYLESHGLKLVIEAYEGIVRSQGIVYAADSGTLQLRQYDGRIREYTVPAAAKVTVNGASKSLSALYAGCSAEVVTQQGVVTSLAIESVSGTGWIQGVLTSTTPAASATSSAYIYLRDVETGRSTRYNISSDTSLSQDGATVSFSKLAKGSFVTLRATGSTVAELISASGEAELSAAISQLSYGATVTLKLDDADGARWCYYLNIADMPPIYRGKTLISIDRLNVGDAVTAEISGGQITALLTEGSSASVEGQLTAITETTNGTTWIITEAGGTARTFALDEMAGCYSGTKAILLSDVRVGDSVSVVVYGSTIVEVYLQSSYQSSTKLSGTVLTVDASARTITILSGGKLLYVTLGSSASMIAASTGKGVSLTTLPVNAELAVYGSYASSTNFTATSVVVESM